MKKIKSSRLSRPSKSAKVRPIPVSEWQWFGNAGHFICGNDCRFHMATQIGDVLVSSVGQMHTSRTADWLGEDIGSGRKFETMAFKVSGEKCECGCGMPRIIPSEIEFDGYNDHLKAREGHMRICYKVARIVPVPVRKRGRKRRGKA